MNTMLVSIDEEVLEGVTGGNGLTISLPGFSDLFSGGANASAGFNGSASLGINLLGGLIGVSFGVSTSANAGLGLTIGAQH